MLLKSSMDEQIERKDFVRFVNRIYYINSHLTERLDELKGSPLFPHLQKKITATIAALEVQISQIDHLFNKLEVVNSYGDCAPMIAFLESVFTVIQSEENNAPYLSLLDYISTADLLIEESAQLAKMSLSLLPKLKVPQYQLHDPSVLQALKTSLYDAYIVT